MPVLHDDALNMTSAVFSLCAPSLVSVGGNFEGLTTANMAEVVGLMSTGLDGKVSVREKIDLGLGRGKSGRC